MFTVALIGPDGAGKTTISRRLEHALPLPVKVLYMGVNLDSSNHLLPSTRLIRLLKRLCGVKPDTAGPCDPDLVRPRPSRVSKRFISEIRANLYLATQISEEWFRQGLAWYYRRRGRHIILFDRHFYCDYYANDIASSHRKRPLKRQVHGLMLQHLYPKPDLTIYLDAPAEVLYSRKREGTLKALEKRRLDYLQMREVVKQFAVVDVTRPEEEVTREVAELITNFYQAQIGQKCQSA